jgi:hypothetical protein
MGYCCYGIDNIGTQVVVSGHRDRGSIRWVTDRCMYLEYRLGSLEYHVSRHSKERENRARPG